MDLSAAFSAEEVAFFAGEQVVTIQATAQLPALQLMDGEIAEISALRQEQVPLWLALWLKRRGKCRIITPDWLEPSTLEATLADERRSPGRFAPLPYHYLEMAYELLNAAEDDLEEPNRIRVALADLEDTRRSKVARGLKSIDQNVHYIKLPDVSATELNCIRGVATGALNALRELENKAGKGIGSSSSGGGAGAGSGSGAGDDSANERLRQVLNRRR